jgi:hypothetical protein
MAVSSTVVDRFNTGIGSVWVSYGAAAWDSTTGRVKVPAAHTAGVPDYSGLSTNDSYTFDDVYAQVTPQALSGGTTDVYTVFGFEHGTTAGTRLVVSLDVVAGSLSFGAQVDYFDASATTLTYDAAAHAWWRIRTSSSNTLWQTSPDGVTWTTRRTLATPTWVTTVTGTIELAASRSSGTLSNAYFDNVNVTPARSSLDLTFVASSAWVAPASSTSIAPTYPAGVVENDVVYLILHSKPDTVTPTTPTGWAVVGSLTGGGAAAQGAGTGPTRMTVFSRIAPAGGLSGSQTVTVTGGSSLVAHMRAYRAAAGLNVAYESLLASWTVATASTTIGGATGSIELGAKDAVVIVAGTTDDQSTTLAVTGVSATGMTFAGLTQDPTGTVVNAQGNDISAVAYRATITAGTTATVSVVVTATSSSSETAMGAVLRVRATSEVPITTATKFYLNNAAAPYAPLASLAGWTENSIAATPSRLGRTAAGVALSSSSTETSATAVTALLRQFVSGPASGVGYMSGTYSLTIGRLESSAAADLFLQVGVWVSVGDSATVRGTFSFTGVEFPTTAAAATVIGTAGYIAYQPGDRIVVEVGYSATNVSASSYTGTIYFGGTGTDLADGGTDMSAPATISLPLTAATFNTAFVDAAGAALGGLTGSTTATPTHVAAVTASLGVLNAAASATAAGPAAPSTIAASAGAGAYPDSEFPSDTGFPSDSDYPLPPTLGGLTAVAAGTVVAEEILAAASAPFGGLAAAAAGGMTHEGSSTALLGALVAAATAGVAHPGAATSGLGPLLGAAAATAIAEEITATATTTLGGLTAAAAASVYRTAIAPATLGSLTATAAATVTAEEITAVAAANLGPLVATVTGSTTRAASAAAPLGGLVGSTTATPNRAGAGTANLGLLNAAAAAGVVHPGVAVTDLGALTAVAAGTTTRAGEAAAALGALTAASTAQLAHLATGGAALGALTAAMLADLIHSAVAAGNLGAVNATVSAVPTGVGEAVAAANFGVLAATAAAVATHTAGAVTAPLGPLVVTGTATRAVTATAAAPLAGLAAVAVGVHAVTTASEAPLGGLAATAAVMVTAPTAGSAAAPLGSLVAVVGATVERAVAASAPLGPLTGAGIIRVDVIGGVAAPLGGLTGTAAAASGGSSSAVALLGALYVLAVADKNIPAAAAAGLGVLAGAAQSSTTRTAAAAADLGSLTAAALATGGSVLELALPLHAGAPVRAGVALRAGVPVHICAFVLS